MQNTRFVIENRTTRAFQFHVEPECTQFEVPIGQSADISGSYDIEPITIQFSDDEVFGVFGAVFLGDGDVVIKVGGQKVAEG